MGFWGPWKRSIGSLHLRDRNIYGVKIKAQGVGSVNITDTSIGFGKLTTGLQGSLAGGIGIEYGSEGTLTATSVADRLQGSLRVSKTGAAGNYNGMTFLPDKHQLMVADTNTTTKHYLVTIGTTSGNRTGSVKVNYGNAIPTGIVLAKDTNKIWACVSTSGRYVYNVGTTTGNIIGSFPIMPNPPFFQTGEDITISDANGHLFISAGDNYIYEMGTTTGNLIGSFRENSLWGVAYNSDHHHLFWSDDAHYVHEIGTTNGNEMGSYKSVPIGTTILFFDTQNIMGVYPVNSNYLYKIGTNFGRSYSGTYAKFSSPFASPPVVVVGKVDNLDNNKGVFSMTPSLGSVWIKAGSYPAKADWIAVGV